MLAVILLAPFAHAQLDVKSILGNSPKTENFRELTAKIYAGAHEVTPPNPSIQPLMDVISNYLDGNKEASLPPERLKRFQPACDAFVAYIIIASDNFPKVRSAKFAKWLWMNPQRSALFLEYFTRGKDSLHNVLDILETLYDHDQTSRDEFFPLMLALALVWDSPRPPMHGQIGHENIPSNQPDIKRRYDFFKQLYASHRSAIPFSKLTVSALCFVVDAPIPVEELEWAAKNIKGGKYEKIFQSIKYDHKRLNNGQFVWPHGPYTLQSILKHGGICVDQAAYTAIAAKSRGVPSIYFSGAGKRGFHAWAAVMKGNGKWDMDIGRYENDEYTAGNAVHPQTGVSYNDHLVKLLCDKIHREDESMQSNACLRIADVLSRLEFKKAALTAAKQAIIMNQTNLAAWDVYADIVKDDHKKLMECYENQAKAFADYPDVVFAVRQRQADILREKGDDDAAEKILERAKRVIKDRDDLEKKAFKSNLSINLDDENADPVAARLKYESFLKSKRKDGVKILTELQNYLDFTKKTGQTQEAVRFLSTFVRSLERSSGKQIDAAPQFVDWDKKIMIQAHLNNNDEKSAEKIRRKMGK
ncbi:MAG: transglutaminase domain-containing protein [Victivallales bacterium]|nr:transglutaminase domain-containing protein [Victivallales bacterium]